MQNVNLSTLKWVKVITDPDPKKWAYTRERLKEMDNVVDANGVTVFPLSFKSEKASLPEYGDLMVLIQKGKVTHIVEILDKSSYANGGWFNRFVRIIWWLPHLDWNNLSPQSELLGFDPTLMNGDPHLLGDLKRFYERWNNDGGLEEFKKYLGGKLCSCDRPSP
ncbi:hypothetical protein H6F78_05350 [Coleofasciculus sp. FACHB-64]|uniref:hypothetical protein n=1 Tax=Cyanophyceae TaxID=3028117 RepID=UPI001686F051|nr:MULTISPECIES: hypothetical protein [unclassified Coleofasciculus]MBD1838335.1 hypothetical protein [Coleofasciculus sp. FACHB-501]MBD2045032.1 hypothetical protein [Coleofasciculus sp. FACHB-64]